MTDSQLTTPLAQNQDAPIESGDGALPEDIVADLLQFETSPLKLPAKVLVHSLWTSLRDAGRILPAVAGTQIVVNFITIFYNMTKNPLVQASFGLFFSYHLIFVIAIQVSLTEKLGIALSVEYGKKNFYNCRRIFTQGILTVLLVYLFLSMPLTLFSEKVFLFIGIAPENAAMVQSANNWMAFTVIVQMANELVKSFCLAQGQEELIGYVGLGSNLVWVFCLYFTIVKFEYGLMAYVMTRFLVGCVEMVVNMWIMLNRTSSQTQGLVSFQEAMVGFSPFFIDSIKFAVGTYSEYLGYEISTFFVASLQNNNKLSAYTALLSITGLGYCLGLAFAVALRTRANVLIGLGKSKTARNYYVFYCPTLVIIGLPFMFSLFYWSDTVAQVYASSNSEMKAQFAALIRVYAVWFGLDLSWHSVCSGLRMTGQVNKLIMLSFVFMVFFNMVSGFLCTFFNLGPVFIFMGLLACAFGLLSRSFLGTISGDWSVSKQTVQVAGYEFEA